MGVTKDLWEGDKVAMLFPQLKTSVFNQDGRRCWKESDERQGVRRGSSESRKLMLVAEIKAIWNEPRSQCSIPNQRERPGFNIYGNNREESLLLLLVFQHTALPFLGYVLFPTSML